MNYKINSMQNIIKTASAALLLVLLVACEDSRKDDRGELSEKKAKLEKLKNDHKKLSDEIAALEKEIAKLDPAAVEVNPKLVSVTPLVTQNFTHYIDLQGKIDADDISYVAPRNGQGGLVTALFVKKGDYVKKGQQILKLDDAVALKTLKQLESQLAFAKDLYQRQQNLWNQNIGTEVQLITAKNNVTTLEDQIAELKEHWAMTNVRAEVSGVAEEVNVRVGEIFVGAPQIKIINTSSLKATVDIPETYVARVRKGSAVQVIIPDLNKTINARVTLVSQSIGENSRGFIADVRIPYDPALKPNMLALVKIQDYAASNVIVIPMNTIQTDEKGKYVYVMADEKGKKIAKKKPVVVGEIYGDQIEIRQGLAPGEQLITKGFQGLYEGQAITTDLK